MASDLPEFQTSHFGNVSKNLICYKCKWSLTNYITLKGDPKIDQFTILVTWMMTDRAPVYATPGVPSDSPNDDGLTIDLSLLLAPSVRYWKVKYLPPRDELEKWMRCYPELDLVDEDLVKAYFYIDQAFDILLQHGIPYLESINEKYGNK